MLVEHMDVRFSVAILSGDKAAALIMVLSKQFLHNAKAMQAITIAVTYSYLLAVCVQMRTSERCSIRQFAMMLPLKYRTTALPQKRRRFASYHSQRGIALDRLVWCMVRYAIMAFNAMWIVFCWWPETGAEWVYHLHFTGSVTIVVIFLFSIASGRIKTWMDRQMGVLTEEKVESDRPMAKAGVPIAWHQMSGLRRLPGERTLSLSKKESLTPQQQVKLRRPSTGALLPSICHVVRFSFLRLSFRQPVRCQAHADANTAVVVCPSLS